MVDLTDHTRETAGVNNKMWGIESGTLPNPSRGKSMRTVTKAIVPFVALAFVAAACGGDDSTSSTTAAPEGTTAPTTGGTGETTPPTTGGSTETTTGATSAPDRQLRSRPTSASTDDTITIGLNADLSGIFAPLVTQIVDGQEAYWEIVNDNGGIAGRQVELVILDNAYDVPTHLENYEEMSGEGDQGGRAMFSQSTGSPHTAATAEMLVEDDLHRDPAVVVLGLGRSRHRAERHRAVHQLLHRGDERRRVPRRGERRDDDRDRLVPG